MDEIKAVLGKGGRISIPAEHRRALGMAEGDDVVIGVVDGEVRISSRRAALERARRIVGRYVPEDVSLVEELSEERRREAEAEGGAAGA